MPLHDLHHIATGYATDPQGEAQVAVGEIAAGTHDKWFALFINLPALVYGFILWPRVSWQTWRLGRQSRTLYSQDFSDELLSLTVRDLRAQTLGDGGREA